MGAVPACACPHRRVQHRLRGWAGRPEVSATEWPSPPEPYRRRTCSPCPKRPRSRVSTGTRCGAGARAVVSHRSAEPAAATAGSGAPTSIATWSTGVEIDWSPFAVAWPSTPRASPRPAGGSSVVTRRRRRPRRRPRLPTGQRTSRPKEPPSDASLRTSPARRTSPACSTTSSTTRPGSSVLIGSASGYGVPTRSSHSRSPRRGTCLSRSSNSSGGFRRQRRPRAWRLSSTERCSWSATPPTPGSRPSCATFTP